MGMPLSYVSVLRYGLHLPSFVKKGSILKSSLQHVSLGNFPPLRYSALSCKLYYCKVEATTANQPQSSRAHEV